MVNRMFESIALLRKRLSSKSQLEVTHAAYVWTASFGWNEPVKSSEINDIEYTLGFRLPEDYKAFLTNVSNGATLYYDVYYGQWGYKLYGLEDLISKQAYWQYGVLGKWPPIFIAFAELYGEANVMLFNVNKPSNDSTGYAVLEGNAYEPMTDWPMASRSFHEWMDHLITAQGDKYWDWM